MHDVDEKFERKLGDPIDECGHLSLRCGGKVQVD